MKITVAKSPRQAWNAVPDDSHVEAVEVVPSRKFVAPSSTTCAISVSGSYLENRPHAPASSTTRSRPLLPKGTALEAEKVAAAQLCAEKQHKPLKTVAQRQLVMKPRTCQSGKPRANKAAHFEFASSWPTQESAGNRRFLFPVRLKSRVPASTFPGIIKTEMTFNGLLIGMR